MYQHIWRARLLSQGLHLTASGIDESLNEPTDKCRTGNELELFRS